MPYPTREEHTRRWEALAREIAAARRSPSSPAPQSTKGSLIVLGSGIQGLSFTMGAEAYLRMADKVFCCVANAPTQVWLNKLRPDNYDLHVLYDDTKPRYHTYVQMTEAILHYVREGMRVVTVFYGHPGIFVLSTHRAIRIARREGHYAVMQPGISALDCLCADIGIDPAFPGMQTFEATDALVRKRTLDTTSHVILWQVGCIGEAGYRRKGFMNEKFPLFVRYLKEFYDPDQEVTHYIAARHASFEPVIARHKIARLLDPRVQSTLTAISTFYIPPQQSATTDVDMAVRLGLMQPGQKPLDEPLRTIDAYGRREQAAIAEFEEFRVADDYQFQERTGAAEFLIEVGQNLALQDLYRNDPARAVSDGSFPGLMPVERHFLAQRNEERAQLAARGAIASFSPHERFIIDLHHRRGLAGEFRSLLASEYQRADAAGRIDSWISARDYKTTLARMPRASRLVNASMLLPWSGVYCTEDGNTVITVIGDPHVNASSLVFVGTTPITAFTFHNQTLTWRAQDGNPHNGQWTFRMPAGGASAFVRTVAGKCWPAEAEEPEETNVVATEVVAAATPLASWTGTYHTRIRHNGSAPQDGPRIEVKTPRPDEIVDAPRILIDGEPIHGARFDGRSVTWGDNRITFSHAGGAADRLLLSGDVGGTQVEGVSAHDHHAPYEGRYRAYSWAANRWKLHGEFHYDGSAVRVGEETFETVVFDRNLLHWQRTGDDRIAGRIQFFIDPATHLPKFIGHVADSADCAGPANLFGVLSVDSASAIPSSRGDGIDSVPVRVWEVLAAMSGDSGDPSRHLLWSQWQRSRVASRLLNNLVPRVQEVTKRIPVPQTMNREERP